MAKVCVAFRSFRAEGFSLRNFNGGDAVFFVGTATFLLLLRLLLNPLSDIKDIIFFFLNFQKCNSSMLQAVKSLAQEISPIVVMLIVLLCIPCLV